MTAANRRFSAHYRTEDPAVQGFGSGGAVPQSLIEPSAVGFSPTGKPAGLPPCRRNPEDFRRLVAPRLCREATAVYSRQKNCVGTTIYRLLSLSRLRRQLPSAVACCSQPATSPRETFGFQRGAAGTLLCKVSGAYHQVEPKERRNPCLPLMRKVDAEGRRKER